MAGLKIGQSAPRFSLKDKDGKAYSVGSQKADYTVLYFYPKDDTPGCTLEAKEFSQTLPKFKLRNVQVVGVSGGNEKTKASFCKKYALKVPLVSDTNFKVSKSYGVYGTKKFIGRSVQGIFRKTFLLDKAGKIVRIFDSVKPEGHAQEVLAAIDALSKKSSVKGATVKKAGAKKSAPKVAKQVGKSVSTKRAAKKVSRPRTLKRVSLRATKKASTKRVAKRVVKRR